MNQVPTWILFSLGKQLNGAVYFINLYIANFYMNLHVGTVHVEGLRERDYQRVRKPSQRGTIYKSLRRKGTRRSSLEHKLVYQYPSDDYYTTHV